MKTINRFALASLLMLVLVFFANAQDYKLGNMTLQNDVAMEYLIWCAEHPDTIPQWQMDDVEMYPEHQSRKQIGFTWTKKHSWVKDCDHNIGNYLVVRNPSIEDFLLWLAKKKKKN